MSNLKNRSISGMLWSVGERISIQFSLLVTSIILGRLLEPEDYGLIGMISIFTAIAQSIIDSGFGTALIQKKDADDVDASSIFFFNLFMGIIIVIVYYFLAPLIANFYNQPILTSLTRVVSLSFIINAFGLIQTSLLTKKLEFQKQFKAGIISVISSSVVGITMAVFNMGVWSLVGQLLSRYLIYTIILWFTSSWRPELIMSLNSLKSMFPFGSRLLAVGILETIFNNIYLTFIGKIYSVAQLGYYSKALTLESSISKVTSSSLSKVTLAAMSPYQNDERVLKKYFRNSIKLTMFIHAPLMIGLIGIADPLIRILLSNKWAPMVPYFQLFCLMGFFLPINNLNINILFIKEKTNKYFILQIIQKIVIIIIIIITYGWGIKALIIGQILSTIFSLVLLNYSTRKIISYPVIDQFKDFSHILFASIIMLISIILIGFVGIQNEIILLITQVLVATLEYYLIHQIYNTWELREVKKIIKESVMRIFNRHII